jgi:predicted MFS family arabinose efflux permease
LIAEKYGGLGNKAAAVIIVAFPIAYMISSPMIGNYLNQVGRKNMLVLAMVVLIFS